MAFVADAKASGQAWGSSFGLAFAVQQVRQCSSAFDSYFVDLAGASSFVAFRWAAPFQQTPAQRRVSSAWRLAPSAPFGPVEGDSSPGAASSAGKDIGQVPCSATLAAGSRLEDSYT